MSRKIGEVDLEWSRDKLSGYQRTYCPMVVDVMMEAIRLGYDLPRVDVVFKDGIYQIRYWADSEEDMINRNNGGHHRALAYMFKRKTLRCNLFDEYCEDPPLLLPVWRMKELKIIDVMRVNNSLSYFTNDVRARIVADLCKKYGLSPEDF